MTNPTAVGIHDTKVLVCSLDHKFDELLKADANSYSRFYASTTATVSCDIEELLATIVKGYDIVHLLADVSATGMVTDSNGKGFTGSSLIQCCCDSNVRLLWMASDNPAERYIKGFRAAPINLVMTMDRKGSKFSSFLDRLLTEMSTGQPMPAAWAATAPQIALGKSHQGSPVTIFSAGLRTVKLSMNIQ